MTDGDDSLLIVDLMRDAFETVDAPVAPRFLTVRPIESANRSIWRGGDVPPHWINPDSNATLLRIAQSPAKSGPAENNCRLKRCGSRHVWDRDAAPQGSVAALLRLRYWQERGSRWQNVRQYYLDPGAALPPAPRRPHQIAASSAAASPRHNDILRTAV